jgi:hypothetical protein
LLDEMDEWIGRAGEAERLAEERLARIRAALDAAPTVELVAWPID